MIALGSTEISKVCLGSNELSKVCLGSTELWSASSPLPYDAEVEYLQSDGNQYFDTGITADYTIESEIKIEILRQVSSQGVLSARNDTAPTTTSMTARGLAIWVNGRNVALNDYNYDSGWQSNKLTYNQASVIAIRQRKLYVDNTLIVSSTNADEWSFNVTYGLLRGHALNNNWDSRVGNHSKLYYCKIWKGGSLVFDGIPVRLGQTGYLYERISGNLLSRLGTGSFVLGPDV